MARTSDAETASHEQQLAGSFRYVGGKAQRQKLDEAIEAIADDMSFFVRGIVRRRLRDANQIPRSIRIAAPGNEIEVRLPGKRPIRSRADGRVVMWKDEYGEDVRVIQVVSERRLVQHFAGEEGSRDITYRLSADGKRLTFNVTIRSRHLPWPLRYRLSYRRG